MITKKQFVEIFEIIIQQNQKDRNTCKILADTLNLDTPSLEGNLIMMYYSQKFIDIMLKMLSYYFKDEALSTIKYYYYEASTMNGGGCVEINGKEYALKTAEDLYDYLVECCSNVNK